MTGAWRTSGDLARAAGVTLRTVRYYEEKRLVRPAEVTRGGRRRYGPDALLALGRVRLLRDAGFSLDAICRTLQSVDEQPTGDKGRQAACARTAAEVHARLRARIGELEQFAEAVGNVIERGQKCRTCPSADCGPCPMLETWTRFGL